jgi:hypothetical protein
MRFLRWLFGARRTAPVKVTADRPVPATAPPPQGVPDRESEAAALVRKLSLRPRFELELMHPEKSDAMRRLKAMGSSASGALLAGLSSADAEGKGHIALLLGDLRHAPAIPSIAAQLESLRERRDFDAVRVKGSVLGALEKYPTEDLKVAGIEAQLQSASTDAAPEIREAASKLLARLHVSAAEVPWSHGANTWEELAENFITLQVGKEAPDFGGFGRALERYTNEQKHGAWHRLAFAFEEKGDKARAGQCFVEALAQDPDSRSTAWSKLQALLALPDGDPTGRRLSALCTGPMGATDRVANAQLVAELRRITGPPG